MKPVVITPVLPPPLPEGVACRWQSDGVDFHAIEEFVPGAAERIRNMRWCERNLEIDHGSGFECRYRGKEGVCPHRDK